MSLINVRFCRATAVHEQGPILQNLIYNNPDFSSWTKRQRKWYIQWLSPTYQLSFSHLCDIKDDNYKSVAPDDMIVEDYDSRMEWINQVAKDFHKLMQRETEHMMRELNIIAQWVDEPDAKMVI